MSDNRFSALASDPRYRLPNRKESRTAIDPRFKGLLTDQEFTRKATVDRYGRKVRPENKRRVAITLEESKKDATHKSARAKVPDFVGSSEDEESDSVVDEVEDELVEKRDPAREGFEGSSSEEESSEEESDSEAELAEETAGQEQEEDIPLGEVARRIAVVNLDWDNIRAVDIMSVAASFVPQGGRIQSVTIFPSEFGRERLDREELEGPPKEIFAVPSRRPDADIQEDDEQEGDSSADDEKIKKRLLSGQVSEGEDFDTAKLRQYQLERLRYYYAVVECDTQPTAKAIYDSLDSREYLSTSNFFDLRFIPDDTSFDDERPHDECFEIPSGYKPNEFRTEALTHSKVRLTWDDEDRTRKEVQKRAFSRAEMDENDLQAYIGTDDSDADSISSRISVAEKRKAAKKASQKDKMRAALGLSAEPTKSSKQDKSEPVGDMQITFTSGLSGAKDGKGIFENGPIGEESTRAQYLRKERERKQKRKERTNATRDGPSGDEESELVSTAVVRTDEPNEEADPFDDPFFNDPTVAAKAEKAAKKADRLSKRQAKEARDAEAEGRRAELELLMADEKDDTLRHFDMREIEKTKKLEKRKGKYGKKNKTAEHETAKDDFTLETQDPRFTALFDSHEYAIDPTNPRFKKTEGMEALLEAGRRKRKVHQYDGDEVLQKSGKKKSRGDEELNGLVGRLKSKAKKPM